MHARSCIPTPLLDIWSQGSFNDLKLILALEVCYWGGRDLRQQDRNWYDSLVGDLDRALACTSTLYNKCTDLPKHVSHPSYLLQAGRDRMPDPDAHRLELPQSPPPSFALCVRDHIIAACAS
jgi:hypothetical protein